MNWIELLIIAIGLSMDAFAVSIAKALSAKNVTIKHSIIAGLYFGGFQFLMPVIGYALANHFSDAINDFDHWIAFGLLAIIGGNMIRESFSEEDNESPDFGPRKMLPLAIATSIDALAVGVSFTFLKVNIWEAAPAIGCVTFIFSFIGILIGGKIGGKSRPIAERIGGTLLILLGIKILLEHLEILVF